MGNRKQRDGGVQPMSYPDEEVRSKLADILGVMREILAVAKAARFEAGQRSTEVPRCSHGDVRKQMRGTGWQSFACRLCGELVTRCEYATGRDGLLEERCILAAVPEHPGAHETEFVTRRPSTAAAFDADREAKTLVAGWLIDTAFVLGASLEPRHLRDLEKRIAMHFRRRSL